MNYHPFNLMGRLPKARRGRVFIVQYYYYYYYYQSEQEKPRHAARELKLRRRL